VVITPFSSIWYNLLNSTLSDANLVKNTDYTITKTSNQVTVTFNAPPLTTVDLDLIKIQISAQITPGWSD
jgi:hypothetical protein